MDLRELAGPHAGADVTRSLLDRLAAEGVLDVSARDELALGELAEAAGAIDSSLRSVLTVHWMVSRAVQRWGDGRDLGLAAFCLTENEAGSDGAAVRTTLAEDGDDWIVDGRKLWVTGARLADAFLVVGRAEKGPTAVLVPAAAVRLEPVEGQLALRGAMLADVVLEAVRVPKADTVGPPGFGWSHVAATALDHGRYTVAWGSVGIAQACLTAAARHADAREQFGARLSEHQLVRRHLAEMAARTAAARALCREAAASRTAKRASALHDTMLAKYAASTAAFDAADRAVQILGAAGTAAGAEVERHFRDARVMRIIEGSDEMQQLALAEAALREAAR
jgi:alkylation response protein AidB-like acyl-CoA dehydrogenase